MKFELLLAAFGLMLIGCNQAEVKNDNNTPPITKVPESALPAESWAGRPPQEWPQLVLTHEAEFQGHTTLQG